MRWDRLLKVIGVLAIVGLVAVVGNLVMPRDVASPTWARMFFSIFVFAVIAGALGGVSFVVVASVAAIHDFLTEPKCK
jgi:hypothetical protein